MADRGIYSDFDHPDLLKMRRMTLLKALAKDDGFAASLKDEKLDKSAVLVHTKRIAGKVPTAEEESSATELVGADTIGSLAGDATTLFIRVELPPLEGSCQCSPLNRPPVMR